MASPPNTAPRPWTTCELRAIHCWTPSLCSIILSRPEGFSFQAGHYARLGLPLNGEEVVWRPYSVVSAPAEAQLEFLITLIPGGAFTSKLALLKPGDPMMVESAAFGFFLPSQFAAGESLWMLATGAGVGPYISMLRQPAVLNAYERQIVVHSVRTEAELAYAEELKARVSASPETLRYVSIVTRQAGSTSLAERIPQLIENGRLSAAIDVNFDAVNSRVMVCGNPAFTAEMRQLLNAKGFQPCRRGMAGSMLFENYW